MNLGGGIRLPCSKLAIVDAEYHVRQNPVPRGESGRGLLLVEALADDWGVMPRPCGPGKIVWAQVRLPGTGGQEPVRPVRSGTP
jgi:hypothetical protein